MKKLIKKWYKKIALSIIIIVVCILGVRLNIKAANNYRFIIRDIMDDSGFYVVMDNIFHYTPSDLQSFSVKWHDTMYIRMINANQYIDVTDLEITYIYDDDNQRWEILSYSYKVHGVNFTTPIEAIGFENFNKFLYWDITEYGGTLPNGYAFSIINASMYTENFVGGLTNFRYTGSDFVDYNILYNYDQPLRYVAKETPSQANYFIDLTNNQPIYNLDNTLFLYMYGDCGVITYYIFMSEGDSVVYSPETNNGELDEEGSLKVFFNMLMGIVNIPIYYLQCLFNFKLLGFNFYQLFFSFVAILFVVAIIVSMKKGR